MGRALGLSIAVVACAVFGAGGCGTDNGLVGGQCLSGYSICGVTCADLQFDRDHCGVCGHACGGGQACLSGVCVGPGPAETPGETPGRDLREADAGEGFGAEGNVNAGSRDASPDRREPGGFLDGGLTGDPDGGDVDGGTEPDAAGEIDAGADADGELDAGTDATLPADASSDATVPADGGADATPPADAAPDANDAGPDAPPVCSLPNRTCSGVCVDVLNDPLNCGNCRVVCASGICGGGQCVGATVVGNATYIGHDFVVPPPAPAQSRVLSNAVFLSSHNPLRIVSYEEHADAPAVSRVKAILAAAAAGRTLSYNVKTTAASVPAALDAASADVLLVYDQASAPAGVLEATGAAWADPIDAFARAGGNIIVLDGAAGSVQEMHLFASAAGLLPVTSHVQIPASSLLVNTAPGHIVGFGVATTYASGNHSARFTLGPISSGALTTIVREIPTLDAVVAHRSIY